MCAVDFAAASCSDGKLPNPTSDPISAVFYCLHSEEDDHPTTEGAKEGCLVGCIIVAETDKRGRDDGSLHRLGLSRYTIEYVDDELELLNLLIDKVQEWDPEVLTGYEIQNSSWGYVLERAQTEYGISQLHGHQSPC